jgi:hypothetical protein
MTLIAGVVWNTDDQVDRAAVEGQIARSLSRHPKEEITEHRYANAVLLKADIGAYDEPGQHVWRDGSVTLIAGNPVLPLGDSAQGLSAASRTVGQSLRNEDYSALRAARGVFAGAHFDPNTGTLRLFSDRLGIRPIYYAVTPRFTVFSTAMRVLESINLPRRSMDLEGVTEVIALGAPLGTRTPYAHVRAIDAAEVIRIDASCVTHTHYWRWHAIPEASQSAMGELSDALFEAFVTGVRLRIGSDHTTAAFLSGGLDSRCVVAALAAQGVNVNTFMFAEELGAEQYCAGAFAAAMGVSHHVVADQTFPPQWAKMIARAWETADYGSPHRAEHPRLVWSGDGGSVGLGWVYVSPEIVRDLRDGNRKSAIDRYLNACGSAIPGRLLTRTAATVPGCVSRDIEYELKRLACEDPVRAFYFFLLLNDQRRHLAAHYEDIDIHRVEYQLPFFDSQFLTLAASIPADLGIGHRFYTAWLAKFPKQVLDVPWQAYPGHIPSLQPVPSGLTRQWDSKRQASWNRKLRSRYTRSAFAAVVTRSFPKRILRRSVLAFVTTAHWLGLKDYGYVLRAATTYHHFWQLAGVAYSWGVRPHDERRVEATAP